MFVQYVRLCTVLLNLMCAQCEIVIGTVEVKEVKWMLVSRVGSRARAVESFFMKLRFFLKHADENDMFQRQIWSIF